jgi:hypothetical protein
MKSCPILKFYPGICAKNVKNYNWTLFGVEVTPLNVKQNQNAPYVFSLTVLQPQKAEVLLNRTP